ncbi:hypothetical protein [Enterococcus faecalis]|uniref:hypothetical protein n=1 Tax=Enterococcus faecalis TaxID=1351 RepID=UPI001558E532|nr:hypothetical protein [Enterococcus faecalis]MEB7954672.1 hypothetical protein [Enterococcus faecalis]MEB7964843.1 hypothetical protein [Enterococcus faecalis]
MEEKKYTLNELVDQLIGPVTPIGDTAMDEKRSQNLDELTSLIHHLNKRLYEVTVNNLDMYASANAVINKAKEASKELSEWFVEE